MKLKLVTLLGVFALGFNAVQADSLNASASVTYLDKYVNRGVYLGDEIIQSSLTVEYNKVYIAINSFAGTQQKDLFEHEWDASLGLIVEDVLFEGTTLDAGLTGYFFPNGVISETQEGYVGITIPILGFDVSSYVYNDFDTEVLSNITSVTKTFFLFESIAWQNGVSVGITDINNGAKYGWLEGSSNLILNLGDHFDVFGGASYTWSDDVDLNDISGTAWSAGVSMSF